MSGGGGELTVGFWYSMSAHMALCHRAHTVTRIKVGDKTAWKSDDGVTESKTIHIDKLNLFGGEEREGGIQGAVDIIMGDGAEPVNSYLLKTLPSANPAAADSNLSREELNTGYMPAFRHITSIVLKEVTVAANNPNLRPWNVEVFYQPARDWYPETELPIPIALQDAAEEFVITYGPVNPAHMIRECLTNIYWGLGYSPLDIDDDSFRLAADQLYAEGFGMSLVWDRDSPLKDFLETIIAHVDGALYVNPFTGLFTLKLFRADYDANQLIDLNESNIISLDTFERLAIGELVNQVVLIWYDRVTDKQRSVTVHSSAAREQQGGSVVSSNVEFPGIGDPELANAVATRELRKGSTAFSRISIRVNRTGASLKVGEVFRFSWDELGLSNVVYRVGRIQYEVDRSTQVIIDAVEDMYAFGSGVYATPPQTLWEDPISEPLPPERHQATEAPYILIERALREFSVLVDSIDPNVGFLTYQATKPSYDALSYSLYTRIGSNDFEKTATAAFSYSALTTSVLVPEAVSTIPIYTADDLSVIKLGTYAIIDDEIVGITQINETNTSFTSIVVNRGILDTVPGYHGVGAVIWFAESRQGIDLTEWVEGSRVDAKAATLTGKGLLDLSLAPVESLDIKARWYRPYPPGNVQVNGLYWPSTVIAGDLVFTWNSRNRKLQLSYYVSQTEGDFTAEAGTTYTVRVYDRNLVLVREETGITAQTWTYTSAMESADTPGAVFTVAITAVRDGVESYQPQSIIIYREAIGYGYNYGNFYGGYEVDIGYGTDYGQYYGRYNF